MMFAEGAWEVRSRSDKEITRTPPPPKELRRDAPVLGVAPARRCPRIDSLSRLQPRPVALATNIIGFMEWSAKSLAADVIFPGSC